jgi:hypothetical protein
MSTQSGIIIRGIKCNQGSSSGASSAIRDHHQGQSSAIRDHHQGHQVQSGIIIIRGNQVQSGIIIRGNQVQSGIIIRGNQVQSGLPPQSIT